MEVGWYTAATSTHKQCVELLTEEDISDIHLSDRATVDIQLHHDVFAIRHRHSDVVPAR